MSEQHGTPSPMWSRILSERGLGTLLAIVLVIAMLWFGVRIVSDAQAFQHQVVAESVRTNEKLEQMALDHLALKAQMDRIERQLLAKAPGAATFADVSAELERVNARLATVEGAVAQNGRHP